MTKVELSYFIRKYGFNPVVIRNGTIYSIDKQLLAELNKETRIYLKRLFENSINKTRE